MGKLFADRRSGRRVRRALPSLAIALLACGGGNATNPGGGPGGNGVVTLTDAQLLGLVRSNSTWTLLGNRADTLNSTAGTGHSERRLVMRFNAKAATQLDASGYIRPGAVFPDSSLIAKELFTNGQVTTLAVMYKRAGDANVGPNDWLWGYFDGSGGVRIALSSRGSACAGCHASGIDYVRGNDLRR